MTRLTFTAEEHARITAAVSAAEKTTDGEIVTIVTDRSDEYRDVALYYALGAMVLVPVLFAAFPGLLLSKLELFGQGAWNDSTPVATIVLAILAAQVILFLVVRAAMEHTGLRIALVPGWIRQRRVHARAVQFFKASAEKRTEHYVGILLYLSLREHRAEIVADRAIHTRVSAETWGEAMAAMIERMRAGDAAGGMAQAIARMGTVLTLHFPKSVDNPNELPDRLIEL